MNKHVLITGGTGLIGSHLTEFLVNNGFNVAHLSRSRRGDEKIKTYTWQISKNVVESGALENADYIIHLAGANISAKRWTESRKEELEKSRTESTYLLYQKLRLLNHNVKALIASVGVGYYGMDNKNMLLTEDAPAGNDFIANLSVKWENTVSKISKLNIRVVQLRTGIVLTKEGGFLKKVLPVVKAGLGAPLGTGNQYTSWIHIEDLCRIYLKALTDDKMEGVYNAVSPHPVSNKDLMKSMAKNLHRPFIVPPVPAFALKLVYGELGDSILGSHKVSNSKIQSTGFIFKYPNVDAAFKEIFKSK